MRILLNVLAYAAIGISIAATPVSASPQDLKDWHHAIIDPKADAGFYLMPSRHGFDEKVGLKVDILDVKDDQIALRALLAGDVNTYEGSPTGVIAAAVRGADVKLLGCEWVNLPHGLMVHDNVNSMKDLEGKSIAVSAPGTMPDMLVRAALAADGIPASTIKFAPVGGDRERYSALVGGVVQAAVVSSEFYPSPPPKASRCWSRGHKRCPTLFGPASLPPEEPSQVAATTWFIS